MIVNTTPSSGISAPCVNDMAAMLTVYQSWTGNSALTVSDLYSFLTVPSADRNAFLSLHSQTIAVVSPIFATQSYVV